MIVSAMTHRLAALYVVRDWPCLLFFVLADDVYTVFVNARALAWFVFSCCSFLRMMHILYVPVAVARAVATVLFALFCVCFGTQQREKVW